MIAGCIGDRGVTTDVSYGGLAGLQVSEGESEHREWVGGLPVSATITTLNWCNYGVMGIVRAGSYPLNGGGKVRFTNFRFGSSSPLRNISKCECVKPIMRYRAGEGGSMLVIMFSVANS